MWDLAIQSYWLTAPVAIAGVLHMFAVRRDLWPRLRVPIDGGRSLGGVRIFGDNKTWRGVVFMTAVAAALGAAQGLALGPWAERAGVAPIDFAALGRGLGAAGGGRAAHAAGYCAVSAVLGLGYALGELPNSFAKRRAGIAPGKLGRGATGALFFLLDQVDSVVFGLLLALAVFGIDWRLVPVGTVGLGLLHLGVVSALYALRIRKNI